MNLRYNYSKKTTNTSTHIPLQFHNISNYNAPLLFLLLPIVWGTPPHSACPSWTPPHSSAPRTASPGEGDAHTPLVVQQTRKSDGDDTTTGWSASNLSVLYLRHDPRICVFLPAARREDAIRRRKPKIRPRLRWRSSHSSSDQLFR